MSDVAISSGSAEPQRSIVSLLDLPQAVAPAVMESGILDETGSISWLEDPLTIRCLSFANDGHYGQSRKRGGHTRLIHEIWCAHQIHNDADLNNWLDSNHIPRRWAILGMVLHDSLENRREYAAKSGVAFNEDTVLKEIQIVLNDPPLFDFLNTYCFPYMTDAPNLQGRERIQAQRAKGYDARGAFSLTYVQQCWRMYDKLSHVVFDAKYCLDQLHVIAAAKRQLIDDPTAITARTETLKKVAKNCLKKAVMKGFVFSFPASQKLRIRQQNLEAMLILKRIAGSLTVDLVRTFTHSAEDMFAAFSALPSTAVGMRPPAPRPVLGGG